MKTLLLFSLLFCAGIARAQFTVVADSLRLPAGIEVDATGRPWVTEVGYGFSDGAISQVQPDGSVWPVIVGLPSFFDTTTQESVGPWHTLALPGNQLAVAVGASGQVLLFDLTGFEPGNDAPLTAASSTSSLNISAFVLGQGFAESNPYSLARDAAGNLYVADAAANAIIKATPGGQLSVFATFPGFPNPLPFGPPMVDAVPTRILAKPGGGFYICQLTGFPFLDLAAKVFFVDPGGTVTTYATDLTQMTDLALDANTGDLYVLQFGRFDLMGMPPGYLPSSARVFRIKTDGSRELVAENFGPSAGMALDGQGNLYVSEIFSGRLLKMGNVSTGTQTISDELLECQLSPNPSTGFTRVDFSLRQASPVTVRVSDALGRTVFAKNLGLLDAGSHSANWAAVGPCPPGLYWVEIRTQQTIRTLKLILK